MGLEFPRSARLTENAAFRAVRTQGKSWRSRCMILGVLERSETDTPARFGIITSKRIGNAVIRNKIRRRFREIIRLHRSKIRSGYWIVLVARHGAVQAKFQVLEDEMLHLFERASILHSAL